MFLLLSLLGWVALAIVAIIIIIVLVVIAGYNNLINKRNRVQDAQAQIDVQLKRRYDLIPNLVNAVKGYMKYEQNVLTTVTKLRSSIVSGSIGKKAKYGPRFDVAADRIAEYSFWVTFTFLGIVPLFVVIIVIIRHSVADAFIAARGTSSKMHSGIAKALYGSSTSRALANVLKFVTFSYMILVYVSNYPIIPAYVLVGILVAFIVARGSAEVYESFR